MPKTMFGKRLLNTNDWEAQPFRVVPAEEQMRRDPGFPEEGKKGL